MPYVQYFGSHTVVKSVTFATPYMHEKENFLCMRKKSYFHPGKSFGLKFILNQSDWF